MLMLGRSKLAQTCYEAWVRRQNLVHPITFDVDTYYWAWRMRGVRPRPRWESLTPVERETWRCVADAAGELLSEAMGAVST